MSDTATTTAADDATTTVAADTATTTAAATDQAATTTQADDLPEWAKDPATAARMVKEANEQAASERIKARDEAKASAKAELLKQLGLAEADETPDPVELKKQLDAKDTTIRDLTIKSALNEALSDAKAKPLARAAVLGDGILADLDPSAADFQATVTQRVAEYISKNPELRASQAAAVGGADISGGAATVRTYTREQLRDPAFYQANKADIDAALTEGRIKE